MTAATSSRTAAVVRFAFVAVGALIAVAYVLLVVRYLRIVPIVLTSDYQTYAAGSERALAGVPLYPAFQLAGPFNLGDAAFGHGFVYPPTAALFGIPVAALGRDVGFAVFVVVSAVLLVGAVFAIARREGLARRGAALMALLYVISPPGIEAIATGQANLLVAALVGVAWLEPRASGYIAVFGGLVKLFPVVGLAWSWRTRAPIMRPIVAGLVAVAISTLVFGPGAWVDFLVTMRNAQSSYADGLDAPRQVLGAWIGALPAAVVAMVATLAAMAAAVRVRSDLLAYALIGLAMILPAPDWYVHYLLIPLVALAPWFARLCVGWPAVWAGLGRRDDPAVAGPADRGP